MISAPTETLKAAREELTKASIFAGRYQIIEELGKGGRGKVYETDPLRCPRCRGQMRIIAFLTDYAVVDRIINHLKLTFVVDKPLHMVYQELLMAAE